MAETDLQAWIFEPQKKHNPTIRSFAPKKIVRSGLKKTFELCNDHWFNRLADLRYIPDKIRRIYDDIALDRKLKRKGPVIPLGELYPERCREPVMGLDMYNLLHKSIITFNKHTDQAWGCVGNMRMFEATGAGTCLVTDTGSNMKDLFEEDKEVVTYSSIDEAIEKVNYLMEHPKEAEKIAKAGQARTLKDHNVMNRCQQINEVIQKVL
jgi:glycosyltransferase involved in cell wall biosynthesis